MKTTLILSSLGLALGLTLPVLAQQDIEQSAPQQGLQLHSDSSEQTTVLTNTSNATTDTLVVIRKHCSAPGDTVVVINTADHERMRRSFKEGMQRVREKGFGGGGGPLQGVGALYTRPLYDLVKSDKNLKNYDFEISRYGEPFYLHGGLGFGGVGNGVRLGGMGMSGQRTFTSPSHGDSIAELKTEVSFGGFLIEKAVVKQNRTYTAGIVLGGGSIDARLRKWHVDESRVFEKENEPKDNTVSAALVHVGLHTSHMYTIMPLIHLGAQFNLPLLFAPEGFGGTTDDFFTASPSVQLRIIFGNLG
jgi:hypothetical protein